MSTRTPSGPIAILCESAGRGEGVTALVGCSTGEVGDVEDDDTACTKDDEKENEALCAGSVPVDVVRVSDEETADQEVALSDDVASALMRVIVD